MVHRCLSRQRFPIFKAFSVKRQIVDELLDMSTRDFIKSEMTDS